MSEMRPATVYPGCDGSAQSLVDVGDEVVRVFEANGQAHGARSDSGDPVLLRREIAAAHELWRHHEGLGRTQARGQREVFQFLAEGPRGFGTRRDVEGDDRARLL